MPASTFPRPSAAELTGTRVAVTGAGSPLGRRVVEGLRAAGATVDVLAESPGAPLKQLLEGAGIVVHLARPAMAGALLEAAGDAAVGHVVLGSSATVYGAWPDNPQPLSEETPLRPNPGFSFAKEYAEVERRAAEWRDDHPSSTVSVLRFVPLLLPHGEGGRGDGETWLSQTVARPSLLRTVDLLPAVQCVHVDDAASAVVHAARQRLDGTYNVAPEGSVAGETARALSAAGVPVPLPERLARIAERWAWLLRLGGAPAPAIPYREHPWVVASDRLRASGWTPAYSAEEALVACRKGSWWRELSPKRRQEVALSVTGSAAAVATTAVIVAIRTVRRRRR